jgi:hypothetical protein
VVDHNSRPKCSLDFQPELDGGRRTMIVAPAALTGHWELVLIRRMASSGPLSIVAIRKENNNLG